MAANQAPNGRWADLKVRCVVVAVLLLALGLRLYRLHEANPWVDEMWTGWVLRESVGRILDPALDPPIPRLHYLLLHYWWPLVGDTEFALRYSSVLFGVGSVAMMYAVGRRLVGATAGVGAALLLTVSWLHISISQWIRMYSLLSLLSLASLYLFARIWQLGCGPPTPQSKRRTLADWGCYFVATLAMMHTHFEGLAFILGENAVVLILAAWPNRAISKGRFAGWLAVQAGLAALFVPQLWYGMSTNTRWVSGFELFEPILYLRIYLSALVTGISVNIDRLSWLQAVTAALVLMGATAMLVRPRGRTPPEARARRDGFVVAMVVFLTAFALVYYLTLRSPACPTCIQLSVRYLLVSAPPFYLVLTATITDIGRRWRLVGILLFAGAVCAGVLPSLSELGSHRRGVDHAWYMARHIAAFAQPGDAVVLNPCIGAALRHSYDEPGAHFRYYERRGLAIYGSGVPVLEESANPETVAAALDYVAQRHDAIWLSEDFTAWESDPTFEVRRWLEARFVKALDVSYDGQRLALFAREARDVASLGPLAYQPQLSLDATLGATIRVVGYDLGPTELLPQERVPLVLYWQPLQRLDSTIGWEGVMVDERGRVVAAGKAEPPPTTTAPPPDATARSRIDFTVGAATPAGRYRLLVSPLGVGTKDRVAAGNFGVRSPAPETRFVEVAEACFSNQIRLTGLAVTATTSASSRVIRVSLLWRAETEPAADYTVFVHVLDGEGRLVAQHDGQPMAGGYPTSRWRAGESVVDAHAIELPYGVEPATLRIGVYALATGARLSLADGSDSVVMPFAGGVPAAHAAR